MKRKRTLFFLMILLIVSSCKREYGEFYDPPKGQEGQIYQQLSANPNLSTFVSAIDLVPGLKEELSSSGLFTVLAPDNEAFASFFAGNSNYSSLDDISEEDLNAIVKFHIMRWMLFQSDFMNPELTGNASSVYRYETRSTVKYSDQSISGRSVPIYYTSKMVQVYTPEYMSASGMTPGDYTDVYGVNSSINTTTNLNFMGASAKEIDIAAGNGSLFILDQVLTPPNNVAQELDTNPEFSTYNNILKDRFLTYRYHLSGTLAQGNNGDVDGDGIVDSLWYREYSINPFLDDENPYLTTKFGISQLTLTAYLPTENVFQQYLDNKLLPGFKNNLDSVPDLTFTYLFNAHLSQEIEWLSSIANGFARNVLGDLIEIPRADIASMKMTSNGLIYKTNVVIEPGLFNAAPGPAFLSLEYSYFADMLSRTGRAQLLASDSYDLTVFAPSDSVFKANGIIYYPDGYDGGKPGFYDITGTAGKLLRASDFLNIIGNHIITNKSLSTSDIEGSEGFYKTWNGSYLATEDGKVHGSFVELIPSLIDPDHDMSNGYFHGIDRMIYPPSQSIEAFIASATSEDADIPKNVQFKRFRDLCSKADILRSDFSSDLTEPITDVKYNKRFTLFVPSNESILAAQEAGVLPQTGSGSPDLTDEEKIRLAKYLRTFFVQDEEIFTDGKNLGTFLSAKLDEEASTFGKDVFVPITVSLPVLTVTAVDGTQAKVDLSDKIAYPQNKICIDGVVHIIDNAFTSQY